MKKLAFVFTFIVVVSNASAQMQHSKLYRGWMLNPDVDTLMAVRNFSTNLLLLNDSTYFIYGSTSTGGYEGALDSALNPIADFTLYDHYNGNGVTILSVSNINNHIATCATANKSFDTYIAVFGIKNVNFKDSILFAFDATRKDPYFGYQALDMAYASDSNILMLTHHLGGNGDGVNCFINFRTNKTINWIKEISTSDFKQVIHAGKFYYFVGTSNILKMSLDGEEIWNKSFDNITKAIALSDTSLCILLRNSTWASKNLIAIDQDGNVKWSKQLSSAIGNLDTYDNRIYFSGGNVTIGYLDSTGVSQFAYQDTNMHYYNSKLTIDKNGSVFISGTTSLVPGNNNPTYYTSFIKKLDKNLNSPCFIPVEVTSKDTIIVSSGSITYTYSEADCYIKDIAFTSTTYSVDVEFLCGEGFVPPPVIEPVFTSDLNIYPNPVTTAAKLTNYEKGLLTIYDMTGRSIYQQAFNGVAEINVSQWNGGVYIARLITESKKGVNKSFVVTR